MISHNVYNFFFQDFLEKYLLKIEKRNLHLALLVGSCLINNLFSKYASINLRLKVDIYR